MSDKEEQERCLTRRSRGDVSQGVAMEMFDKKEQERSLTTRSRKDV